MELKYINNTCPKSVLLLPSAVLCRVEKLSYQQVSVKHHQQCSHSRPVTRQMLLVEVCMQFIDCVTEQYHPFHLFAFFQFRHFSP